MGFKDYSNAKYGDIKQNPNQFYTILDERQKEYKDGVVTERRDAYTTLPSLEQAQKRIGVYKVLRIVLLVLGIVLVITPIVVASIVLRTLDEYSETQSIILGACLFMFVLGVVSLFFCRAVHIDYGKCQMVILSQNDNSETVK